MYGRWWIAGCFAALSLLATDSALAQSAKKVVGKKPVAAKNPEAVPGNYRQLIARHIAQHPQRARLLNAQISPPGLWESPLGLGTVAPIACARLTIRGTFSPTTFSIGYRFKDGQISQTFNPEFNNPAAGGIFAAMALNSVTCGKLTYRPFPELMAALKSRPKAKSER